ncbi:MAG: hypothetical protein GY870_22095 [archaeon]|nr:hypothetical protein [archaeon]
MPEPSEPSESSNSPEISEFHADLKPIFASSIMYISKSGLFNQILTYDYYDDEGSYLKKIRMDQGFYNSEVKTIAQNMQNFMDNCINKVNGEYVYPKVIDADIDSRNDSLPFFYWIIKFKGDLIDGENLYESDIDEEELEYSINSIYILEEPLIPNSVETELHYEIDKEKRIIKYWGNKGEWVGPKEILRFTL